MATKRVISVNESSLVDLKAELYRKETQFKKEKVDSSVTRKPPIWQKKKKETKKGREKDLQKSSDENVYDKELEKSRLMLEAKSALYEKLSTGEIEVPSDEDDQDGRFLVDFHQKTITKENKNENDITGSNEMIAELVNPDEEWVDYVDSFGRSRKCLKKDLSLMQEKDNISIKSNEKAKPTQNPSFPTLLSDDMRREMIRKKWEKEVEETLDKPVGPVHYQNVLFSETRDHGVGYFQFSKAEKERQEQQTLLKNLRTQTEQQRNTKAKLLAKRQAAKDARLQKVKERKLKKLKEQGLAMDDEGEDEKERKTPVIEPDKTGQETLPDEDENEIAVGDMLERIRNTSTKIINPNKWEKKKIDLTLLDKPKPKATCYKPQDERNPEFAPPSFYSRTENKLSKQTRWNNEGNEQEENSTEQGDTQNNLDQTPSYNSYPQETPILTITSQGLVDPNFPPPMIDRTHHTYPSYPPPLSLGGNNFPNLPPPPTHAFSPPILVQNIPSNLSPPLILGSIPPNLPPPPTHDFPPPFISSLYTPPNYPPPQFSTTPNYSTINIQPPGTE